MKFEEKFNLLVGEWLRERGYTDVVTVTGTSEELVSGGYCDTCAYESIETEITYLNAAGKSKRFNISYTLSDIIYNLTKIEERLIKEGVL